MSLKVKALLVLLTLGLFACAQQEEVVVEETIVEEEPTTKY